MANQVGWFEVVGQDGEKLRSFYGDVFGWQFQMPEGGPEGMDYGMVDDSQAGTVSAWAVPESRRITSVAERAIPRRPSRSRRISRFSRAPSL